MAKFRADGVSNRNGKASNTRERSQASFWSGVHKSLASACDPMFHFWPSAFKIYVCKNVRVSKSTHTYIYIYIQYRIKSVCVAHTFRKIHTWYTCRYSISKNGITNASICKNNAIQMKKCLLKHAPIAPNFASQGTAKHSCEPPGGRQIWS